MKRIYVPAAVLRQPFSAFQCALKVEDFTRWTQNYAVRNRTMRKAFIDELTVIAKRNKNVVLLTADLGFMVLDTFQKQLPRQFYNVGVMEQNMVGVATGLAMNGYIPFIYSITTFVTLRSFEFIRNGPSEHNLPVRIVGIGSGVEYSHDGLSHHAYEDIAVMRTLPNLSIIAPADDNQTKTALRKTWDMPGPIYYRISKNAAEAVPNLKGQYKFNSLNTIRTGRDCIIFATGTMVLQATKVAKELEKSHISCTVSVISTIKPVKKDQYARLLSSHRLAVTLEAHNKVGGIGSLIAEIIAGENIRCKLVAIGLTHTFKQKLGHLEYFYAQNGLALEQVANTIKTELHHSPFTSFVRRFF